MSSGRDQDATDPEGGRSEFDLTLPTPPVQLVDEAASPAPRPVAEAYAPSAAPPPVAPSPAGPPAPAPAPQGYAPATFPKAGSYGSAPAPSANASAASPFAVPPPRAVQQGTPYIPGNASRPPKPAGYQPTGGYGYVSAGTVSDDAVTIEPETRRHEPAEDPHKPLSTLGEIRLILKEFVKKNEKVIWWLHTTYALSLGAFVATFAAKGFERARMLTLSLGAAWLLVVFFFRFFGTGAQQDFMTAWPGMRRRFFIMSYLMKNLFQGMLFYLLPFYWKSASIEAKTYVIVGLLSACAILSTLDLVFDRVLLRFKLASSFFFALTLFGCANLVIPALLPNTPIITTYLVATGLSLATFMLFHMPLAWLRKPVGAGVFAGVIVVGVVFAYVGRRAMPPVPLTLKEAGVGPSLREDGSLSMEIRTLRPGKVGDLYAVTDVQVVGNGEHFRHVWKKGDRKLDHESADAAPAKEKNVIRVASKLPIAELPDEPEGKYTVDVVTDGDQVVGRVVFEIKP